MASKENQPGLTEQTSARQDITGWDHFRHIFGKHKTRVIARYCTGNILICDVCAQTFTTFGGRLIRIEV